MRDEDEVTDIGPQTAGQKQQMSATEAELEALWDDVARESEKRKAAGIAPSVVLPQELMEFIRPQLDALGKIFGKTRGETDS